MRLVSFKGFGWAWLRLLRLGKVRWGSVTLWWPLLTELFLSLSLSFWGLYISPRSGCPMVPHRRPRGWWGGKKNLSILKLCKLILRGLGRGLKVTFADMCTNIFRSFQPWGEWPWGEWPCQSCADMGSEDPHRCEQKFSLSNFCSAYEVRMGPKMWLCVSCSVLCIFVGIWLVQSHIRKFGNWVWLELKQFNHEKGGIQLQLKHDKMSQDDIEQTKKT